ncbi:energy transducer TonB [Hymenobacter pini]|uniref:energy transducer TonB n=1 Tax=Hymenobacter pini TaxID=2880879 RepID=UPI001CF0E50D|nr:energy transducer TonB [Hymenobacter pini]
MEWPAITGPLNVNGWVFVSFVVDTDGQVYQAQVRKGIHPLFGAEALRIVKLLNGRFSLAICGGVARAHEMVAPVSFFRNSVSH